MSSGEVSESEKDTLKTVRELLEKAEDSARKALNKAAPAVQKSVETSVDAAAKGFAATMKSIDGATSKEQLELLKAYRKVLGGQVDFGFKDKGAGSEEARWGRRSRAGQQVIVLLSFTSSELLPASVSGVGQPAPRRLCRAAPSSLPPSGARTPRFPSREPGPTVGRLTTR